MTSLPALQPVQTQRQPLGGAGLPEHARPRRVRIGRGGKRRRPCKSTGARRTCMPDFTPPLCFVALGGPSRLRGEKTFAMSRRQRGGGALLERTPRPSKPGVRLVDSRPAVEGPLVAARAGTGTASTEELTRTTNATNRRRCARKCVPAIGPGIKRSRHRGIEVPTLDPLMPCCLDAYADFPHASFSPPRAVGFHAARAFSVVASVPGPRRPGRCFSRPSSPPR